MNTEELSNEITNNDLLNVLNEINQNSVATNNSIKELQEYLIIKDRQEKQKEDTEREQAEQQKEVEAELQDTKEAEEASAKAEQSAKAEAQEQTYTELLTDIRSELQLQNQMISGEFLFFGIICGILLFKILWDKLT